MWFTENPWPGVIIAGVIGVFFLSRAVQTGRSRNGILAVLFFALAGVAYVVEGMIITPAEEIEAVVYELAEACTEGDVNRVQSYISANNLVLRTVAATGLSMAKVEKDLRITDLSVRMAAENSRGISHFRANGTFTIGSMSYSTRAATRWEVTWQKEGGEWKIIQVQRLNPITGNEMGILERSET